MVYIIGAGLAGSILKRVLDLNQVENTIYDCEREYRASIISENLFSLSWGKTLGHQVVTNGVKTLESVVEIKSINFKTKAGHNNTLHVHPDNILVKDYIKKEVEMYNVPINTNTVVVDCRGYWATISEPLTGLAGQGLFIKGTLEAEPQMNFVAPYVHQKLFQWSKSTIWYGDSTCIGTAKYFNKGVDTWYIHRCAERADELLRSLGLKGMSKRQWKPVQGIRPVVQGHKGYLKFDKRRIWNTGGWKCGLIIYADHAQRILEYLKQKRWA